MKKFDTVRLIRDFGDLPEGTEGCIVLEYDGTAFEVEFFDTNGKTLCVLTTPKAFLQAVE